MDIGGNQNCEKVLKTFKSEYLQNFYHTTSFNKHVVHIHLVAIWHGYRALFSQHVACIFEYKNLKGVDVFSSDSNQHAL